MVRLSEMQTVIFVGVIHKHNTKSSVTWRCDDMKPHRKTALAKRSSCHTNILPNADFKKDHLS